MEHQYKYIVSVVEDAYKYEKHAYVEKRLDLPVYDQMRARQGLIRMAMLSQTAILGGSVLIAIESNEE